MKITKYFKLMIRLLGLYPFFRRYSIRLYHYKKQKQNEKLKIKWRLLNKHNYTGIGNTNDDLLFPIDKVKVGNYSYGLIRCITFNTMDEQLKIGNFCSIGQNVSFILGGEHHFDTFSSYPFNAIFNKGEDAFSKGPIIVEDDVWIGYGATVLSGVTLSKGTVVAAGSVVVKSTEPYSIVGGNPAKLIRYRFDDELIDMLMKFDFVKITDDFCKNNLCLLYKPFDKEVAGNLLSAYERYSKSQNI